MNTPTGSTHDLTKVAPPEPLPEPRPPLEAPLEAP
jgi:hypothetical protein